MRLSSYLIWCALSFCTYIPCLSCKAGIVRNQHGLCKLILPVCCPCFSVFTSQKMVCLVTRIDRYDVLLQLLVLKFKKKRLLIKKKQNYSLLHQMSFFHYRTQIKGFYVFSCEKLSAYIIRHMMTHDHTCDVFSFDKMSCNAICQRENM